MPSREEESTVAAPGAGALEEALCVVVHPKVVFIVLKAGVFGIAALFAVGLVLNDAGDSSPAGSFRAPAVNADSAVQVDPDEA